MTESHTHNDLEPVLTPTGEQYPLGYKPLSGNTPTDKKNQELLVPGSLLYRCSAGDSYRNYWVSTGPDMQVRLAPSTIFETVEPFILLQAVERKGPYLGRAYLGHMEHRMIFAVLMQERTLYIQMVEINQLLCVDKEFARWNEDSPKAASR